MPGSICTYGRTDLGKVLCGLGIAGLTEESPSSLASHLISGHLALGTWHPGQLQRNSKDIPDPVINHHQQKKAATSLRQILTLALTLRLTLDLEQHSLRLQYPLDLHFEFLSIPSLPSIYLSILYLQDGARLFLP